MGVPAYQDRSLSNRSRERWADIPGLEGYYRISNFGRVRRLERWVPYADGTERRLAKRMLALRVQKVVNRHIGDHAFLLSIPLRVERQTYEFQIRRLVYHCFVQAIDLCNPDVLVISKNGDGLDVRPANLAVIHRSEQTGLSQHLGRRQSFFTDSVRQKGTMASVASTARVVSQYNAKGIRMRTFASMMEASRETGVSHSRVAHAASGRSATGGGYYWRYGQDKRIDVAGFWKERKAGYQVRTTPVNQYTLGGKLLSRYPSLKAAASSLGVEPTGISANLREITRTAYGYRWKYG